jgi:type II secretory pathway component PulJ
MRHAIRRSGKSLIEMLMLMSILSVILATTSATLIALMKTDRQLRRDLDQQTALARLAEKFRFDAHAATTCQVDTACQFAQSDGRTVRYEAAGGRVVREIRRGDAVEHRDSFVLPEQAVVTFSQPSDLSGRLVQLQIATVGDADTKYRAAVRPALVEAALGVSTIPRDEEASP